MNFDYTLFVIVFLALAVGWVLARIRHSSTYRRLRRRAWRKSYMEGIHLLLNEESDRVIENLIQTWDVSNDNFDLHNALANMLRRKGEVDRAIRIHANIVESENLNKEQLRTATIELASDYIRSGLLDRAERLLINVVNSSKEMEERALVLLQQVYELEREWQKAIVIAEQLVPLSSVSFDGDVLTSGQQRIKIANYFCELAEAALAESNYQQGEKCLKEALAYQYDSPRVLRAQASLMIKKREYTKAQQFLKQLSEVEPGLIVDCLDLVEAAFADSQEQVKFLKGILENYPSSGIEGKVFYLMKKNSRTEAMQFLSDQIRRRPTLKGLDLLLTEQEGFNVNIELKIRLFHELVSELLKNKPNYQCRSCGFSGMKMYWQCPGCHSWDSIRLIRGGEGD
ncbi:MAG: tetratricopeptide repeat protein [Cellvibrionales bacterium]|nr:tetratricopeptide repeat protein [Cellvibrionales bacterium]